MERRSFLLAATWSLGATLMAWPQGTLVSRLITLRIPFSFVAEGKTLPAGEYSIAINSDPTVLIRSTDAKQTLFVFVHPTQSAQVQKEAKLVFYRFGESYFLSEIWPGDTAVGRHLRVTPAERLSANNWPKTRVEVKAAIATAAKRKK